MTAYIARRILLAAFTLLFVSFISFAVVKLPIAWSITGHLGRGAP